MVEAQSLDLRSLREQPYRLLAALDQRLQARVTDAGVGDSGDAWVGLGFRIDEQWHLAPQREVREVITLPNYSRVPNSREWLLGIANVRGNLLPLIDTRRLLDGRASVIGRESRFMVINSDEVPAGFLVDGVSGYRRFAVHEQRNDLVAQQRDSWRAFMLGGFVRDQQSFLVFSFLKLISADIFQNASG